LLENLKNNFARAPQDYAQNRGVGGGIGRDVQLQPLFFLSFNLKTPSGYFFGKHLSFENSFKTSCVGGGKRVMFSYSETLVSF
jgi:hypothetical protein